MQTIINHILRFGIIELFVAILIFINLLTFTLYLVDKHKAIKGKWRISENTLIFFTLIGGGIGALIGMRLARHKTCKTKFKFATTIGVIIALVALIHIAYGLTLGQTIRYVELEFHSENWPSELDGYRIAFMTDMHTIPDETMRNIAAELNARNLDLLLLGGDFSMRNEHYQGTLREIARINVTDGIFGVEGNHDDYRRLFAAKEQHGIIPLDNSGMQIRRGFHLAGVQDLWNRTPDIQRAIANASDGDFVLLVSHNPDVTMQQSTAGIDLILAGHTHGGHITIFGYPIYLLVSHITHYGTRFASGFSSSRDGVLVFVSRAVGDYYGVPKIFARPEVVIFTLYNKR